MDQHGPHHPEPNPAVARCHLRGPAAGHVPLHQSADVSRDWPPCAASGARVAGTRRACLWHYPVTSSLLCRHREPTNFFSFLGFANRDTKGFFLYANVFIVVIRGLCILWTCISKCFAEQFPSECLLVKRYLLFPFVLLSIFIQLFIVSALIFISTE